MKVRARKMPKVHVVTLGCSKNVVDSETLMGQLQANRIDVVHDAANHHSEIVIINTCGFIESAKQQSIDTILQFAEEKKQGRLEKLYVTGCLSERYKSNLETQIPEVDAYFGTRELPKLLKTLKANYREELLGERILTNPAHYAYLKISEGCDRPCSFCAIPLMRGGHVSVPIDELVKRAKALVSKGTRELLLIAQDSTYYGLDLYKSRKLAELMDRLSDIENLKWLRLHYAFPSGFPLEVLDIIQKKPNICKYLDMPLQHINTRILTAMKRGITKEKIEALIQQIRERVSGITLRSTFISGFPGETPQEHEELLHWLADVKLDRMGVFTYSHEEQTGAYALKDTVSEIEKKQRADALMEMQYDVSLSLNQKKIGQTVTVLFDRKESGFWIGRTEADSPDVDHEVYLKAEHITESLQGVFKNVRITSAGPYDLYGDLVP